MENNLEWTNKHPVSGVKWIPIDHINSNNYNPNSVAPPEMKLLQLSIESDGYTQPIVVWMISEKEYEVVDGFHRYKIGAKIGLSHLPVVIVNSDRSDISDRMASTIRHNRARGVHQVGSMSDIVKELVRKNWNNKKIGKELGMEADEVLRLKQISGLSELFNDEEFSEAWEIE